MRAYQFLGHVSIPFNENPRVNSPGILANNITFPSITNSLESASQKRCRNREDQARAHKGQSVTAGVGQILRGIRLWF